MLIFTRTGFLKSVATIVLSALGMGGVHPAVAKSDEEEIASANAVMLKSATYFSSGETFKSCLGPSLDVGKLDYSLASLVHVDDYLQQIHVQFSKQADGRAKLDFRSIGIQNETMLVITTGAYVGEIIRRNSGATIEWIPHSVAVADERLKPVVGAQAGITNAFVIRGEGATVFAPFSKVLKFLVNGKEDSVKFYADTILELLKTEKK